jgi:hypothetical protein
MRSGAYDWWRMEMAKAPTIDFPISVSRVGFTYGPVTVERLCDIKNRGVWLWLGTKREQMEIRVTPGGRIRVERHGSQL